MPCLDGFFVAMETVMPLTSSDAVYVVNSDGWKVSRRVLPCKALESLCCFPT